MGNSQKFKLFDIKSFLGHMYGIILKKVLFYAIEEPSYNLMDKILLRDIIKTDLNELFYS